MVRPSDGEAVHGEWSPDEASTPPTPPTRPTRPGSRTRDQRRTWSRLSALQPMVGRDLLLDGTRTRVLDPASRLSTLAGPVGVGKSRLALAVAESLSTTCPQGVHVVDLRAVGGVEPGRAVATALRLPSPEVAEVAEVAERLRESSMLLVLDGCEVARDQVVELISTLLPAAPGVRVLATGRAPLGLYGEQLVTVPPLEVPDPTLTWTPETLAEVPAVANFLQALEVVEADSDPCVRARYVPPPGRGAGRGGRGGRRPAGRRGARRGVGDRVPGLIRRPRRADGAETFRKPLDNM